jgi:4-hydroxybenzoate polyprenyltransferase
LLTNPLTILLSLAAAGVAAIYPFVKRISHLPQIVLGVAFSFGIPMAFSASQNALPPNLWLIFLANLVWTMAYDTIYAMVDRDDDLIVGIKSTAILFGKADRLMVGLLQGITAALWLLMAWQFDLHEPAYIGIIVASGGFVLQQWRIKNRNRMACFQAFRDNIQLGLIVFVGIAVDLYLYPHVSP